MAPLKIIGAGYGRTGTDSLRLALNQLGFNTHHMCLIFEGESDPDPFMKAWDVPGSVDWDEVYADYDAAVDWPTNEFLPAILKKYPESKVILTVRDPDSWYQSVKGTVYLSSTIGYTPETPDVVWRARMLCRKVILGGALGQPDLFNDADRIKQMYLERNQWVMDNVPKERLLVMQLGEGWHRLCEFLDKPVPENVLYPHTNSRNQFVSNMNKEHKVQDAKLVHERA